jgi:tRNA(fMet)-specific endonuclease VapC
MKYLLDTNVCVGLLRGKAPKTVAKLEAVVPGDCVLCSIVVFELYYGAKRSLHSEMEMARVDKPLSGFVSLPFTDRIGLMAADLRKKLEKEGLPIGPYDLQIAAIALENKLVLVTANSKEFQRVPGLTIQNWEA